MPSLRFSILSRDISIPNTNFNPAEIHFEISPPLPTAKSINVFPFSLTFVISILLTTLL